MSARCERHGLTRCRLCKPEAPKRECWLWTFFEGIGELVIAVLEGLADADWEDD